MKALTGKQQSRLNRYNPSTGQLEKLMERNTTDNYSNPGIPVTEKNQFGRDVIKVIDNGNKLLMNNTTGASPKGDLPFLQHLISIQKNWISSGVAMKVILKVLFVY